LLLATHETLIVLEPQADETEGVGAETSPVMNSNCFKFDFIE